MSVISTTEISGGTVVSDDQCCLAYTETTEMIPDLLNACETLTDRVEEMQYNEQC